MLTIHGNIVTPTEVAVSGSLVIDDGGKIAEVAAKEQRLGGSRDIDATGYLVLPGFLDMHVHGGGGADFMHGAPDAVRQVARTHARFGTTGLLATTLTASRDATDQAILAARTVANEGRQRDEARILGIHLEGPYICPARRGAQPAQYVREADVEEFAHWVELSGHMVRQITIAPEMPGAEKLIRDAHVNGVIASIGHTDANADQTIDAIGWGARHATHLFNAMTGIRHREPGVAGAVLSSPEIVAELIADGVHLHPLVVRLILAAKGPDGAVLITDAMEGAAMPDAEYDLGGTPVIVRDGTASFADGTLAGSVLTMNRAFHNACRFADLSPVLGARFASANAARELGMADRFGSLAPGYEADIAILNPITGEVAWTIIGGEIAYQR